jgi:hypothetical protein
MLFTRTVSMLAGALILVALAAPSVADETADSDFAKWVFRNAPVR